MARLQPKSPKPAESASVETPSDVLQQVTVAIADPGTPEAVITFAEPPKPAPAPRKYFPVKLLKNYRPHDAESWPYVEGEAGFVVYELDDPEDDPEDIESKRIARKPTPVEMAKVRAGEVIGLSKEEARRVMMAKIGERFDAPSF